MSALSTQPRVSALALMAERCCVEPAKLHSTLKNTVFKGATDDELLALVVTSNTYDLNPLLKEIYAFPKKGGGIVPMVPIDGWLKIANRQSNFNGMEVEVFGTDKKPTHATCEIFVKDRDHSVKITEYYEECFRNTDPWNQMPRRMLRNKAISQAVRVAFGVSGFHDEDEANDMRETTGRVVTEAPIENPFPELPNEDAPSKPARNSKPKPKSAEAADLVEIPAEEVTQNDGKIHAFYEGVKIQTSVAGAEKPWKLWRMSYTPADGEGPVEAVTFSKTIGDIIDKLEGGEPIIVQIVEGKQGYVIQSLELSTGGQMSLHD